MKGGWRVPPVLFLVLGLGLAGCGDAATEGGGGTAAALAPWSAEVDLRVGSLDDPETSLTTVGTILPAPDGRVYVGKPQDGEVRIHGPAGELLGRFGGRGDGPGEFQFVGTVGWWGGGRDTLWISDPQLRRLSLFTPDGSFVRSIPVQVPPYREVMTVRGIDALLADGTGLATPSFGAQDEIQTVPLLRFSLDGDEVEPVVETPLGNRQLNLRLGAGLILSSQFYADAALVRASAEAGRVVVVRREAAAYPEGARFRVTALTPAGDTLWSREYGYEPVPLPRSEADSVVQSRVEMFSNFAGSQGMGRRELEGLLRDRLYVPAFRPPVESMLISPDGGIWLRMAAAPEEEVNRWWGLDPDGEPTANLELPDNVSLRWTGGTEAWGVETDEFDVPYLVRFRLGPATP